MTPERLFTHCARKRVPQSSHKICWVQARVTSLEQLSLAEFRGEKARPKSLKTTIKMFSGFRSIGTRRSKFGSIFSNQVH